MREHAVRLLRNVGQSTGFIPYEVPFDTLVQEPARFRDKWVKTAGVYHPVSRRVITQVEWITGASMLPDTRVERNIVAEQGVMTDARQMRAVRIYRVINFRDQHDQAQEAARDLPDHRWTALDGDIRQGFPGEYFLRATLINGLSV